MEGDELSPLSGHISVEDEGEFIGSVDTKEGFYAADKRKVRGYSPVVSRKRKNSGEGVHELSPGDRPLRYWRRQKVNDRSTLVYNPISRSPRFAPAPTSYSYSCYPLPKDVDPEVDVPVCTCIL